MSRSIILLSGSFWIDVSEWSLGLLLLRILLNISKKAIDWGSALLAYFEIYCKAACILKTGFKSIFALQPYNCNLLCKLIYGSFLAVLSSGCPYLSSRIIIWLTLFLGYPNLQVCCFIFLLTRMQYEGLQHMWRCSLFINSI